MVKQPMTPTHTVCYHYYGIIIVAVVTDIRSNHLVEIFITETWLEIHLNV